MCTGCTGACEEKLQLKIGDVTASVMLNVTSCVLAVQGLTKVDLWLKDASGTASRRGLGTFPSSSSLGELEGEDGYDRGELEGF